MEKKQQLDLESLKTPLSRKKSSYFRGRSLGQVCGLAILVTLAILTVTGSIVTWSSNVFHEALMQQIVIRNGSSSYTWWQRPPVKPLLYVRVFNYSNAAQVETGRHGKLNVTELGPYVYRQSTERVNVQFNDNGTVSYQDKKTFEFVPELSTGSPTDVVTVPNIPLASAISELKSANMFTQLAFYALTKTLAVGPFVQVPVKGLLWGYSDPLFSLARTYLPDMPHEKFGLMTQQAGVSANRITIYTGETSLDDVGRISMYNGADRSTHWGSAECNRVDGTEGSLFAPRDVHPDAKLYIYSKELCRKMPLVFKQRVLAKGGIPALRFEIPRDVYGSPDTNPENTCFCHPDLRGACPPSGVFNISPCAYGAPVMLSFPHFYLGDPALLDTVNGLHPDEELHDTYVDLHSVLGVALSGVSRFQLNVMVQHSAIISHFDHIKDGSILPIVWFEVKVEELPDDMQDVMQVATFTVPLVQQAAQYGCLTLALVSLFLIYWCFIRSSS